MADSATPALIAAAATLITAYGTQFIAEKYRRFHDGSALAAGLAGELNSYRGAYPVLSNAFQSFRDSADRATAAQFFRPFPRPTDLFFDEVVSKLGLLGAATVEDTVFVYGNLRAFRNSMETLMNHHAEMSDFEFRGRCGSCLIALNHAHERGTKLVPKLHARAAERFWTSGLWSR